MKKILFFLITPLFVFAQNTVVNNWYPEQSISFLKYDELDFVKKDTNYLISTLKYAIFSGKGQFFDLQHKQTLNDFFDIFLTTQKLSQEGVYNQSELKMHDVDWGLNFKNRSSTYEFNLKMKRVEV